ncbi:MAG: transglutaminase domain-containing protein [Myxococcales bacterium]
MAFLLVGACDSAAPHTYIPRYDPRELDAFGAGLDDAVTSGGKSVLPPAGGPLREGEEKPMLAGSGDGMGAEQPGRRSVGFRPDRITELEGTLGYYEVFTPAITPFKRVTALDSVALDGTTPVLLVSDASRVPVRIEGLGAEPPDSRERDRFWGSVVLDFTEGNVLPLPTVSPESRILTLSSEPLTSLRVERDAADNFVIIAQGTPASQVRVTYVLDAPRSYFGAALPDSRADSLAREVPPLPESVRGDAGRVLRELKLRPDMPANAVLKTLVEHFRAFEESREPPRDTGNIYLDLARNKRGVCRHRTYAFVITAQALGIPCRFVQNEAHAWAELKLPEVGWLRLDLGGAAAGLDPRSVRDREHYRPAVSDPWPRPLAYEESYSRAAELMAQAGAGTGQLEKGDEVRRPGDMRLKPTLAQGQSVSSETPLSDNREPIVLRVSRFIPEVMRGSVFEVEGSSQTPAGSAVPGLRVEVSLAQPMGTHAVLLGVVVSDAEGKFHGSFAVPPNLNPSDYALVVVTPGDAKHGAARAQ